MTRVRFAIPFLISCVALITTIDSPASATLVKPRSEVSTAVLESLSTIDQGTPAKVSLKTDVNSVGGDGNQSYPCSVLQYFANSKIETVDLAEVALWLGFVIDGDPVTTDASLLTRLGGIRELAETPTTWKLKSEDSRRTLIEIANEACGPCSIEKQNVSFSFDQCWLEDPSPTTTTAVGLNQTTEPNSTPPSSAGNSGTPNGPKSDSQALADAKAALQQQLSGRLGTLEPEVLSACNGIFAVVPRTAYVDIYSYASGSWGLSKSNDLPGEVISIEKVNVLSGSSLDFWVKFKSSNSQIYEALLIEAKPCSWGLAAFQLSGSGFLVKGLQSLSFDGSNVVGSDQGRSNIKFVYDKTLQVFKEQP